jgi:hypothetical protein
MARDGATCFCGAPATDVHHIDGNWRNDDLANLRAVCAAHNPKQPRWDGLQ